VRRPPHRFSGFVRRTSAVLALSALLAGAMPALADHPHDPTLPRHLALSEPRPSAAAELEPSLHVALAAALHPVAERMSELSYPYASVASSAGDGLPECCRSMPDRGPESSPGDPNDLMGVSLGPGAILGLQVDLVGPIELRETYTRLTNPRKDPTDLRNVLTSFGLRVGF
jgi:hypothetical protein